MNRRPASASLKAGRRSDASRDLTTYPTAPAARRCANIILIAVDSQEHELRPRSGRPQRPHRLDPVQERHRNVEHQDVGREPGGCLYRRPPVADSLDHFELRFEESRFDLEERLVIVGQQDTGPAHRSLPSAPGA